MIGTISPRFVEVSSQGVSGAPEAGEARLWNDGVEERSDELARQAPEAGTGQAAVAQRGESSSSSMMGSSKRIIKRWAKM